MRLSEILLVESFPDAKREFKAHASDEEVNKYIDRYRDLIKRNLIKDLKEKDINTWRKAGWDKFKKYIDEFEGTRSKTAVKRKRVDNRHVFTLLDNDTWDIVVPLDHATSCNIGKHTRWCVSKPGKTFFQEYVYKNGVILVTITNKHNEKQWAISVDHNLKTDHIGYTIFDSEDTKISDQLFNSQTGLNAENIIQLMLVQEEAIRIKLDISEENDPVQKIEKFIKNHDGSAEAIAYIEARPGLAELKAMYADIVLHKRWKPFERDIAKDPDAAFKYVIDVMGGKRWPEGEQSILKDPLIAYEYARDVIKGRWPEAEHIINTNTNAAKLYKIYVADTMSKQNNIQS